MIERPQRNTDERQEARNPAKRRACEHDVAIVQYQQDTDETECEAHPLNPRYRLSHEPIGDGRCQNGLNAWYQR